MRLSIFAAALCATACAPVASFENAGSDPRTIGRQCFSDTGLRILQNDGSRDLYVRVTTNEALRLETATDCFTDRGDPTYDFRPLGGPAGRLCIGEPVRVDLRSSVVGLRTCQATVVAQLSDEQVAALPNRRLP